MKPLNTQERNSSFWSFVLFFTIAAALITAVVSFNFIIPEKQFAELKIQVREYADFKAKQSGFMNQIDGINAKLKEYDVAGARPDQLGNAILKKNSALEDAIGPENATNKVYLKMIDNYKIMVSSKAKLSDAKDQLSQANAKLYECETENRKAEKDLNDKINKK